MLISSTLIPNRSGNTNILPVAINPQTQRVSPWYIQEWKRLDRLVSYQIHFIVSNSFLTKGYWEQGPVCQTEFADVSNPEGELILTICRNSQQRDNKALWGGALWKLNKSQLEKISRLEN